MQRRKNNCRKGNFIKRKGQLWNKKSEGCPFYINKSGEHVGHVMLLLSDEKGGRSVAAYVCKAYISDMAEPVEDG